MRVREQGTEVREQGTEVCSLDADHEQGTVVCSLDACVNKPPSLVHGGVKNRPAFAGLLAFLVEMMGIEPTTSALRTPRSPN